MLEKQIFANKYFDIYNKLLYLKSECENKMKSKNIILCIVWVWMSMASCTTQTEKKCLEEYAKREVEFRKGLEENWEERDKINKDFAKWLLKDTCTYYYDFPHLTDSLETITITTSDDGKVRIYSWDTWMGGTMIDWDNVIQYRSTDSKLKTFDGCVWDIEEASEDEEGEGSFGCYTKAIYSFQRKDGQTVYVTDSYFRESSIYGFNELNVFCISDGKLQCVTNAFVTPEGEMKSDVGVEYIIPSWYFLTDGRGWDWVFSLDKETQTFYLPVTREDMSDNMTDQYDLYKFNGYQFVYIGRDGGYWLHPSLRKFDKLSSMFKSGKYLIRVDQLQDGSYRYASWSGTEDMRKKPDIVIHNGVFDELIACYTFTNGDYKYLLFEQEKKDKLEVYHKNKRILSLDENWEG